MNDEILKNEAELNGGDEIEQPVTPQRDGPTVPKPEHRPADLARRIQSAVDAMLEDSRNPYELVIVASREARRINERKLKARSILNQTFEPVEELIPDVPFMPRNPEDDEPEIKATNESLEKMACGMVDFVLEDNVATTRNYYGEIDFPTDPEEQEETDWRSAPRG